MQNIHYSHLMKVLNKDAGRLEMIIGCMYSSKSSTLISKIRQHEILGKNILIINHKSDTRYNQKSISSHDNVSVKAVMVEKLGDIPVEVYKNKDSIFIEEAQFFSDLYELVYNLVEVHGKYVVLCGLDGDYQRKPYQQIMELIPLADLVDRKNAMCIKCKDGTLASFSKRIVDKDERNIIGGIESYMPVCRFHYHNHNT